MSPVTLDCSRCPVESRFYFPPWDERTNNDGVYVRCPKCSHINLARGDTAGVDA